MPTKHGVNEGSKRFKIDPESRNITNRLASKTVLVQGDINSERLVFELPRFIAGHDMTLCDKIEVHYINIKEDKTEQSEDVYPVKDIAAIPDSKDLASFSWLVSGNATKYMGVLGFLIRFACMKDDELVYAWHTNIYDNVEVGKGMNNGEAVKTKYADILEAWKAEIISKLRAEMEGDIIALREQLDTAKAEAKAYTDTAKAEAIAHTDKLKAETDKRLNTLESLTLDYPKDSGTAYEKAVPLDVYSTALLKSIGGASKASKNVLDPNKIEVLYSSVGEDIGCVVNSDGSLSFHLSEDSAIHAEFYIGSNILSAGKYYVLIEGATSDDIWGFDGDEENGQKLIVECYAPFDEVEGYDPNGRDVNLKIMLYKDTSINTDVVLFEEAPEGTVFEPFFEGFRDAKVERIDITGTNLYNGSDVELNGVPMNKTIFDTLIEGASVLSWKYEGSKPNAATVIQVTDIDGTVSNIQIRDIKFYKATNLQKVVVVNWNSLTGRLYDIQINKGATALEYRPYSYKFSEIPEAVRNLEGWGRDGSILTWNDDGTITFTVTKDRNLDILPEPSVTDVTGHFPKDFDELKVEPAGTIRFVNPHKMAVPSTIGYVKRKE